MKTRIGWGRGKEGKGGAGAGIQLRGKIGTWETRKKDRVVRLLLYLSAYGISTHLFPPIPFVSSRFPGSSDMEEGQLDGRG